MRQSRLIKKINNDHITPILTIVEQDIFLRKKYSGPLISKSIIFFSFFLLMIFSFLLIPAAEKQYSSYVWIDINPSVEFIVNEKDLITDVRPLNKDGAIVIYNEAFIDLNIEDATRKFVNIANDLSYITPGQDINVSVVSDEEDFEFILAGNILVKINELLIEKNIDASVKINIDNSFVDEAKSYGISVGKLQLIKECIITNQEYSILYLVDMKVTEIKNITVGYTEDTTEIDIDSVISDAGNGDEAILEIIEAKKEEISELEKSLVKLEIILKDIIKYEENPKKNDLPNIQKAIDAYNGNYGIINNSADNVIELKTEISNLISDYQEEIIAINLSIKLLLIG